jgi:DNA-binding ferritin-like protein (Dps family)
MSALTISATLSRAAISAVMNTSPRIGLFVSFFPVIDTVGERIIELDFKKNGTNVASYVNPNHKSKSRNMEGFNIKAFVLPTKKDKYTITSDDLAKKLFGTTPYTQQSSLQAKAINLMDKAVTNLRENSANKDEISAIEQCFTGTLAIVGEGENRSLDFERSADNSYDPGAGNYAGEAGFNPSEDFDNAIEIAGESGHVLTHFIGRPSVVRKIVGDATIKEELDNRRTENGMLAFESRAAEIGAIYYGMYKEIQIWGYSGNYKDEDGDAQKKVPAKQGVFLSRVSQNGTIEGYAQDVAVAMNKEGVSIDSTNFITKVEVTDEPSDALIHGIQTSCPLLLDPDSTVLYQVEAP